MCKGSWYFKIQLIPVLHIAGFAHYNTVYIFKCITHLYVLMSKDKLTKWKELTHLTDSSGYNPI